MNRPTVSFIYVPGRSLVSGPVFRYSEKKGPQMAGDTRGSDTVHTRYARKGTPTAMHAGSCGHRPVLLIDSVSFYRLPGRCGRRAAYLTPGRPGRPRPARRARRGRGAGVACGSPFCRRRPSRLHSRQTKVRCRTLSRFFSLYALHSICFEPSVVRGPVGCHKGASMPLASFPRHADA